MRSRLKRINSKAEVAACEPCFFSHFAACDLLMQESGDEEEEAGNWIRLFWGDGLDLESDRFSTLKSGSSDQKELKPFKNNLRE